MWLPIAVPWRNVDVNEIATEYMFGLNRDGQYSEMSYSDHIVT